VPCIVTDIGDSAKIVAGTGLVVKPGDAEAFAQAISRLLDAGAARRSDLGSAARQRIESEFSLHVISQRYQELYCSLAGI